MSSTGALAVTPSSYTNLFVQGLSQLIVATQTAYYAGTLRTFEHYKLESMEMAMLGFATTALAQILTKTAGKNDFKSLMLKASVMGVTIIGISFALQKWSNAHTLPFGHAVRLAGLEVVALAWLTVVARRFEHAAPPQRALTETTVTVPTSAQEVREIAPEDIGLYHQRFWSDLGAWITLPDGIRIAFIKRFFENGYGMIDPVTDGTMNADWLKLPNSVMGATQFTTTQIEWLSRMIAAGTKRFRDFPNILVEHAYNVRFITECGIGFGLTHLSLDSLRSIMSYPKEPNIIELLHLQFAPEEAGRFDALFPEVQTYLNSRFAHYHLEERPTHTERLTAFTPEIIRNLNIYEVGAWHAVLLANKNALWDPLPLEKKMAFNRVFAESDRLMLIFVEDIAASPVGLDEAALNDYHSYFSLSAASVWRGLREGVRVQFIEAFYTSGFGVVDINTDVTIELNWERILPNTVEDVERLTDEQVEWLDCIFNATNKFLTLPSILVQHAFNKRIQDFSDRFFFYHIDLDILEDLVGHVEEEGIMEKLRIQFTHEENAFYTFAALCPDVQQHLNRRFEHFGHHPLPTRKEQLKQFQLEEIGGLDEDAVTIWYDLLQESQEELWDQLPLERKAALNDKFQEFEKELFPWGDFETYPAVVSRNFFQAHRDVWESLDRAVRSQLAQTYDEAGLPAVSFVRGRVAF